VTVRKADSILLPARLEAHQDPMLSRVAVIVGLTMVTCLSESFPLLVPLFLLSMRGIPGLLESLLRPQLLSPANAIGAPYLTRIYSSGSREDLVPGLYAPRPDTLESTSPPQNCRVFKEVVVYR